MVKYYESRYQTKSLKRQSEKINYKNNPDLQKTLKIKRQQAADSVEEHVDTQTYHQDGKDTLNVPLKSFNFSMSHNSDSEIEGEPRTPIEKMGEESSKFSSLEDSYEATSDQHQNPKFNI